MASVGEQLKTAREAKGLSVEQVAETTKIRSDHIRALEHGDYDVFSAPVYIKGFVRTYSGLLKLDVPAILAQTDQELSKTAKHHEHPPLTEQSRGVLDFVMFQFSRMNLRIAVPVAAILLVLLIGFWIVRSVSNRKHRDPLAGLGPGIYQPNRTNHPGEILPLPPLKP